MTLFGYLVGSVPFGYLVGRARGVDIRTQGSGNIGATNVFRVLGKGYGIGVFVLDSLKGVLPVVYAGALYQMTGGAAVASGAGISLLAGLAAIIGHNYTWWLGFKGGKGVATSAGALLALMPLAMVCCLIVWAGVFFLTRYVSLASIAAALALPAIVWILATIGVAAFDPFLLLFTVLLAFLAVWRHRSNIKRLMDGTEHRMGSSNKEAVPARRK